MGASGSGRASRTCSLLLVILNYTNDFKTYVNRLLSRQIRVWLINHTFPQLQMNFLMKSIRGWGAWGFFACLFFSICVLLSLNILIIINKKSGKQQVLSYVFYKESDSLSFTRLFYSCWFSLWVSQHKYFLLFTRGVFFFVGNLKAVMVCGEENMLLMSPCWSMTDFAETQEWVLNK